MITLLIAAVSCAAWIYLLVGRGAFWLAAERDEVEPARPPEGFVWPSVVAIVPARDEASLIGETVQRLLQQDYRGAFAVVVVDDHSSDDTARVARRAAAAAGAPERLTILAAPKLPAGWTGKLSALHRGIQQAEALAEPPVYLLLTDADIRHSSDSLTALVLRAIRDRLVLTSLLAKLRCASAAERVAVPAFVFFFQMLYPFAWVRRADRPTAAAAGGCILVERQALRAAGGVEVIRNQLIDDCALARLLKRHGRIWLGLSNRVESARGYRNLEEIGRMVSRSAYAQLGFSPLWLAAMTAGMVVAYVAPPLLVLTASGAPRLLGALAWAQMALALQPILHFYGRSPLWGFALPATACIYLLFTLDSAWRHWRGGGGEWKGRVYRHESPGRGN